MVEFSELPQEDVETFCNDRSIPIPVRGIRIFYAHEDGVLHGYFIARLNEPFEFCSTCPGNCISGGGLWVDPEFRNRGTFKKLFGYSLEQVGASVTYSQGHGGIQGVPYLLKYGVRLQPEANPQPLDNEERLV